MFTSDPAIAFSYSPGQFTIRNGVIEDFKMGSETDITVPDGVTAIGKFSFDGCKALTSVTLPGSVTSIREYAFDGCTGLTSVTLPDSLTSIENSTFLGCDSLTNVIFPNGLTSIRYFAFQGCDSLTNVTFPDSLTSINDFAFCLCKSLKFVNIQAIKPRYFGNEIFQNTPVESVSYAGTKAQWRKSGWPFLFSSSPIVSFMGSGEDFVINNRMLTDYVGTASDVTIPEGVTSIGSNAFKNNNILTSVTLPDSLTSIEDYAFCGCSGLTCFIIPEKVKHIGNGVLNDCTSLQVLTILPINIREVGNLLGNTKVRTVYYAGTEEQFMESSCSGVLAQGTHYDQIFFGYSPLVITAQPQNQSIILGKPVTLSLTATGDGLTYQWYYKKVGQTDFSIWNGRTHATETCTPNATWDGIQLYCLVKDSAGNTEQSDIVTVTVTQAMSITTQPTDKTITIGQPVTLSLTATGNGLTYQWYYKKKGASTFSTWNGRTHASETVTPNATWDGIQLYCVVKDSAGNTEQSDLVTVTVTQAMSITTQPTDKTITLGESVTLSLTAKGDGLKYQWYYKKKGASTFSTWNGRTHASETVTPNATWDGIQLYCVVKDSTGKEEKSDTISVKVNLAGITITQQPQNQNIIVGDSLTLTIKATGDGLKYQWYYKKKGQTSFNIWNGRTHATETVSPNNTWDGIQLYCVIKDSSGNTLDSIVATISVLSVTTQPKDVTVSAGSNVTFIVKATGSGLKYQWQYKKAGQTA